MKQPPTWLTLAAQESLPVRERGLKQNRHAHWSPKRASLPVRERGLKHLLQLRMDTLARRSPCGAWIEAVKDLYRDLPVSSLPVRERGLKQPV